jgi:hypothetical protein
MGMYQVNLVCVFSDAAQLYWELGEIEVWFKEGTRDKDNRGVNSDYVFPRQEIMSTFPPSDKEHHSKKSIFAYTMTIAILGAFGYYVMHQQAHANLERIDFWGILFTINLLVLLGVILAFWIQVGLITTLWALLFYSPVALFLFNRGLTQGRVNCDIE